MHTEKSVAPHAAGVTITKCSFFVSSKRSKVVYVRVYSWGALCRYDPNGRPPRGEICIRGPLLFKEYYRDQKKTDEAMGKPHVVLLCGFNVTHLLSYLV